VPLIKSQSIRFFFILEHIRYGYIIGSTQKLIPPLLLKTAKQNFVLIRLDENSWLTYHYFTYELWIIGKISIDFFSKKMCYCLKKIIYYSFFLRSSLKERKGRKPLDTTSNFFVWSIKGKILRIFHWIFHTLFQWFSSFHLMAIFFVHLWWKESILRILIDHLDLIEFLFSRTIYFWPRFWSILSS